MKNSNIIRKYIYLIFLISIIIINCNNKKIDYIKIGSDARTARFMPDGKSIILVSIKDANDDKEDFVIHKYDIKMKKIEKLYKMHYKKKYLKDYQSSFYDFHILSNNNAIITYYSSGIDSKNNGRICLLNLNNFSEKIYQSHAELHSQSHKKRNEFLTSSGNEINIFRFPNTYLNIFIPKNLIIKDIYVDAACFSNKNNIVIFIFSKKEHITRYLYFYDYLKKDVVKIIKLPYKIFFGESIWDIQLSPNGKYLLMSNIRLGLYVLDFNKSKLYEIDIFKYFPDNIELLDWSWDSKNILVYIDDFYIFSIEDLLKIKRKELTIKKFYP